MLGRRLAHSVLSLARDELLQVGASQKLLCYHVIARRHILLMPLQIYHCAILLLDRSSFGDIITRGGGPPPITHVWRYQLTHSLA